ncbi:MAG: hypothetical protein ABI408_09505 [Gemmatimonadaceae bacterium]
MAALLASGTACRGINPFATDQSVILGVTNLDAPATIAAGGTLTVTLIVSTGGCVRFDHLEVSRGQSNASITAWGIDSSKGNKYLACPENIVSEPHSQSFDPPFQGTFTVAVNRGRLSPLTATIQVQ